MQLILTIDQQAELQILANRHYVTDKKPPGPWRIKMFLDRQFGIEYNHFHKTITGTDEAVAWLLLHL